MAETGNDISVQNQSVNIPGLASARRTQEQDVQNQEIENDRVEETRQAEVRQEDIVSVNENGPGAIEQQEIRTEGETLNVPSQDIQENLGQSLGDQFRPSQTVADLNSTVVTAADRSAALPDGPSGIGAGGVSQITENFEPDTQQVQLEETEETASAQPQTGAQSTLEILEPDEEVDTGPANNPVQGGGAEGLTEDEAGLAATSTGRPNSSNEILRQEVEEDAEQRANQESQANNSREPDSEVSDRGQNVDRLV